MATEDDSDIPDTGAVFTFGKSRFADNSPNKFWIRNDKVVQVCCGDEHSILVAGSGRVFAFGCNDWGQLGLGHNRSMTKPGCIKSLKGEKITHAACGRQHTIVSADSGKLYAFGANGEGQLGLGTADGSSSSPKLIESIQPQVWTMLAAGTEHSVALSEDGIVYVWGCGDAGQLGLGDQKEAHEPTELFIEDKVIFIAAGYYHTALVTTKGTLFTFGENENGQLGIGEVQNVFEPTEVENISGKVVGLSCGGGHTVVFTDKGKVYSYGNGENGQLGHGNTTMQLEKPVEMFFGKDKIKAVSCGENHTALITTKGQLYTCGDGRHGKLGLGEENFTNQFRPAQVPRFINFSVEQVSCGGCHMLVIAGRKIQNGDWESSEEDEGIDETDHAQTPNINHLRKSEDMDLTGSFSARNRRRIKQEPLGTLGRNLPELDGTLSRKSNLPPLSATAPISSHSLENKREKENPLNRSMLPPLKKEAPDLKSFGKSNGKHKDEDDEEEDSEEDEDEEDEEEDMRKKRAAIKKQSADLTASAPVPKPKPRPSKNESEEEEEESEEEEDSQSEEDEGDSDEKEDAKPNQSMLQKEKPVPASRQRKPIPKTQESEEEDSEEDSEEEEEEEEKHKDLKKKKDKKLQSKEKAAKAKKKEESEDEDDDEEEESEEEDKKKKKKEKESKKEKDSKKEKEKGKKKKGIFGKSKIESEEEESEEEEEEEDEKDKKKKKSKEKEKEKDKKGKKKSKEEEEDDDEDEDDEDEEDESAKSNKQGKGKQIKPDINKKSQKGKIDESEINDSGNVVNQIKTDELKASASGQKDEKDEATAEKGQSEKTDPKVQAKTGAKEDEKDKKKKEDDKKKPEEKKKSRTCVIL